MPLDTSSMTADSSEAVDREDVTPGEGVAQSSSADQDEAPSTMLDAVRAVLEHDEDEGAESSPAERVESDADPGHEPAEPADRDEALLRTIDELKDASVPLHKIERFRELLTESKSLKGQLDAVRPAVDRLAEINDAARRIGLTPDDVAELMTAPIVAKDDPAKAHEILSRFASRFAEASGKELPGDLQTAVDDGEISEERAREVAQLRAAAKRAETERQVTSEDNTRREVEERLGKIVTAVNGFQRQIMTSDPNYTPAKHQMVKEAMELLIVREGRPDSPEKAVELAKRAHETVTSRLKELAPSPRQLRQPSGRRINSPAQGTPKTMREAVERAIS
jgi:hypothetical protein